MQAGSAPTSVLQLLAAARRWRTLRSALESAALGLAAAGAGVAAALISGSAASERMALCACGLLCGVSMAATWWVERAKLSDLELAQRIDRKLGVDGALATAFELRARGGAGALASLLEQRVLAAVDLRSLRSAMPAAGWIWLAPPAAGAALVAMALELPARPRIVPYEAPSVGYAGARPSALERARDVLDRALAASDPRAADRRRAELDAALLALGPEGRRNLEPGESVAAADALASRLSAALAELSPAAAPRPGSPGGAAGQGNGGAAAEAGDSGLAIGSGERTMVGSNRPAAAPVVPAPESKPSMSGGADEAGTLAGRWWPERYDPVVQGWRRALAARKPGR